MVGLVLNVLNPIVIQPVLELSNKLKLGELKFEPGSIFRTGLNEFYHYSKLIILS